MTPMTRVTPVPGWDRDPDLIGARRTVTYRVTYKGHLLGNATDEAEAARWIEDMRRMEDAGDYDPAQAERDRVAFLVASKQPHSTAQAGEQS